MKLWTNDEMHRTIETCRIQLWKLTGHPLEIHDREEGNQGKALMCSGFKLRIEAMISIDM